MTYDVALIIPYYNDDLSNIIEALDEQVKRADLIDRLSVVCINNGGAEWVPSHTYGFDLNLIDENQNLNSPYSARNRGVEAVSADWYIFLDATCIPKAGWLDQLAAFQDNCVYAANVRFFSKSKMTVGDLYDSIINIDNERTVQQGGFAKTACLAAHISTVNAIGKFEEGIRSGGDVLWTRKCHEEGMQVVYSSDWQVLKASRNTSELLMKQIRVSRGWYKIWKQEKTVKSNYIKKVVLGILPPNPIGLFSTARRRGVNLSLLNKIQLFILGWFLRIVSAYGVLVGTVKK